MWSGTLSCQHQFELGNGGSLAFAADVNFASSRYVAVDYIVNELAPGYVRRWMRPERLWGASRLDFEPIQIKTRCQPAVGRRKHLPLLDAGEDVSNTSVTNGEPLSGHDVDQTGPSQFRDGGPATGPAVFPTVEFE